MTQIKDLIESCEGMKVRTLWPEARNVPAKDILLAAYDAIANGDTSFSGEVISLRDAVAIVNDAGYYTVSKNWEYHPQSGQSCGAGG